MDINSFIRKVSSKKDKFDYIYIDPPFNQLELVTETVHSIIEYDILTEETLILIEHVGEIEVDKIFDLIDRREYGKKYISFYKLRRDK